MKPALAFPTSLRESQLLFDSVGYSIAEFSHSPVESGVSACINGLGFAELRAGELQAGRKSSGSSSVRRRGESKKKVRLG